MYRVSSGRGISRRARTDPTWQVTYRLLSLALQVHVNTAKQYGSLFKSEFCGT
jgi:hypothetical protein